MIKSYDGLIKQGISRKGNCWDNAVAESFFKSLKVEWIYRYQYQTRLHSALGLKSIEEFEQQMNNLFSFCLVFFANPPSTIQ